MITALQPRQLILLVVGLFLTGMVIAVLGGGWVRGNVDASPMALMNAVPFAVTICVLLAAALGNHRMLTIVWKVVPALNSWIAPDLNGTYELRTTSNWPTQQAMLAALNKQPFTKPDGTAKQTVSGMLSVKLSLFRLTMAYMPSDQGPSRSRSDVLAASVHMDRRAARCELHYVYHSRVFNPNADTDIPEYYGAARFVFPLESARPEILDGTYWTDRSWPKGINTAGQATAKRLS